MHTGVKGLWIGGIKVMNGAEFEGGLWHLTDSTLALSKSEAIRSADSTGSNCEMSSTCSFQAISRPPYEEMLAMP